MEFPIKVMIFMTILSNCLSVNENLYPIIEIIPIQILSYYLALKKNANPDYPRNLAKSVTVK